MAQKIYVVTYIYSGMLALPYAYTTESEATKAAYSLEDPTAKRLEDPTAKRQFRVRPLEIK